MVSVPARVSSGPLVPSLACPLDTNNLVSLPYGGPAFTARKDDGADGAFDSLLPCRLGRTIRPVFSQRGPAWLLIYSPSCSSTQLATNRVLTTWCEAFLNSTHDSIRDDSAPCPRWIPPQVACKWSPASKSEELLPSLSSPRSMISTGRDLHHDMHRFQPLSLRTVAYKGYLSYLPSPREATDPEEAGLDDCSRDDVEAAGKDTCSWLPRTGTRPILRRSTSAASPAGISRNFR